MSKNEIDEENKLLLSNLNINVDLATNLVRFKSLEEKDSKIFKDLLFNYFSDIVDDLSIPVNLTLKLTRGEYTDTSMTSFTVIINEEKSRMRIPRIISPNIASDELARRIAETTCENPSIFLPISISEDIQSRWAKNLREDIKNVSLENFHRFLLTFISRRHGLNRAYDYIKNSFDNKVLFNLSDIGNIKKSYEDCVMDWDSIKICIKMPNNSSIINQNDQSRIMFGDDFYDKINMMRDGLYYELGILLPNIDVDVDGKLKKDEFRVQINDLLLPISKSLSINQFMVNDTPERLKLLKLKGVKIINPANESINAIVEDLNNIPLCKEADLSTWNYGEHMIIALSSIFRKNADCFINGKIVDYYLSEIESTNRDLVTACREKVSLGQISVILRELLKEEVPINNFKKIMEILLLNRANFVDNSMDNAVVTIRNSMGSHISKKYSKDGLNLAVYLLDHKIEKEILEIDSEPQYSDEWHSQFINFLYQEIGDFSLAGQNPIILTTSKMRVNLYKLINREFNRMRILSYNELDRDINVIPISLISFSKKSEVELYD